MASSCCPREASTFPRAISAVPGSWHAPRTNPTAAASAILPIAAMLKDRSRVAEEVHRHRREHRRREDGADVLPLPEVWAKAVLRAQRHQPVPGGLLPGHAELGL